MKASISVSLRAPGNEGIYATPLKLYANF